LNAAPPDQLIGGKTKKSALNPGCEIAGFAPASANQQVTQRQ
jgi:hypothetical protein